MLEGKLAAHRHLDLGASMHFRSLVEQDAGGARPALPQIVGMQATAKAPALIDSGGGCLLRGMTTWPGTTAGSNTAELTIGNGRRLAGRARHCQIHSESHQAGRLLPPTEGIWC